MHRAGGKPSFPCGGSTSTPPRRWKEAPWSARAASASPWAQRRLRRKPPRPTPVYTADTTSDEAKAVRRRMRRRRDLIRCILAPEKLRERPSVPLNASSTRASASDAGIDCGNALISRAHSDTDYAATELSSTEVPDCERSRTSYQNLILRVGVGAFVPFSPKTIKFFDFLFLFSIG